MSFETIWHIANTSLIYRQRINTTLPEHKDISNTLQIVVAGRWGEWNRGHLATSSWHALGRATQPFNWVNICGSGQQTWIIINNFLLKIIVFDFELFEVWHDQSLDQHHGSENKLLESSWLLIPKPLVVSDVWNRFKLVVGSSQTHHHYIASTSPPILLEHKDNSPRHCQIFMAEAWRWGEWHWGCGVDATQNTSLWRVLDSVTLPVSQIELCDPEQQI